MRIRLSLIWIFHIEFFDIASFDIESFDIESFDIQISIFQIHIINFAAIDHQFPNSFVGDFKRVAGLAFFFFK